MEDATIHYTNDDINIIGGFVNSARFLYYSNKPHNVTSQWPPNVFP